ncbi:MAG TPA: BON domain-containing protein [Blastocatellia bacterium]|nr:BON domain-containing protein [Blastocatellia bacterium]
MVAKMKRVADSDLGREVLAQIRQRPELIKTDVKVAVDSGVVTLTGLVRTESERKAIEAAAKEVWGVEAIASDLLVKPLRERSDADIAKAALNAFHNHILIPASDIMVIVRDGSVTLEGTVRTELQSMLAEAEIKRLRGIESVSNRIEINPEAHAKSELETRVPENAGLSSDSAWVEPGEAEAG